MKRRFFFLFLLLWSGAVGSLWAQEPPVPEKVYVHLDRTCYAVGETMWLAGYVENALPEADTSRFLYVELLDPEQGEALLRTKVKQGPDGFAGHLDLPDSLASGDYLLRAYTRWQLNWPEDRMFRVPVRIYGLDGTFPETLPAPDIDVSFYPEGGRDFSGDLASLGFKAMDAEGRGVALSGVLVDDRGTEITTARTMHEGMGLLSFTPEAGRRYRFVTDDGNAGWDLPAPEDAGATLQVRRIGEQLFVKVINRTGAVCQLSLCGPAGESLISEVRDPSRTFRLESSTLPSGLQKFRLLDPAGNIFSERAVFLDTDAMTSVALSVRSEGDSYAPRVLRKVSLSLPSGMDTGTVSVSVVRATFRPWQQEGGIGSYMLLGSELRGHVANPDYYFDPAVPAKERRSALDLLLLIQGWTYYDFMPSPSLLAERERTQTIAGEVRGLTSRMPRKYLLSVICPSLNYTEFAEVAEGRTFVVDSLDFCDSTAFILAATRDGILQQYRPVVYPDPVAPPAGPWGRFWPIFDARRSWSAGIAVEEPAGPLFPESAFQRETLEAASIQADYVRIKSPFGSTPRTGAKTREDLKPYDMMNLLNYVLMMKPTFSSTTGEDGTTIVRNGTSYEYFGNILLCVDGMQMPWDLGETILVGDVEKLSISLRDSDSFLLHADGVVLVELSGPVRRSLEDQGNTSVHVPLGWQTPRAFYHPRYDRARAWVPDQRNTIYWNPSFGLKGGVENVFTFYTDDQSDGPYFLRIEGRTAAGRWISTSQTLN